MKRFRIVCIVIVLCMLACGTPSVEPAETPVPVAQTEETPASTNKDTKEAALLYAGERVNLYLARAEDSWGVVIEEFTWEEQRSLYQPFPGTQGIDSLNVTEIKNEADESLTEALFYIRYLDADGQPRMYCLDHPDAKYPLFYPTSDEDGIALTEDGERRFGDAMLIGYLYEHFRSDYAKKHPDDWEWLCQRRILDALFYKYEDALPPYLKGEDYDDDSGCCFVTQTELDGFFRSVVDRPNYVPDRIFEGETDPDLLPGQVPMWPTDYEVWPTVRMAVCVSDGEYLLYGNVALSEGWCPAGVICRVVAADGFLGWRVVDTKVSMRTDIRYDTAIAFVPVSGSDITEATPKNGVASLHVGRMFISVPARKRVSPLSLPQLFPFSFCCGGRSRG